MYSYICKYACIALKNIRLSVGEVERPGGGGSHNPGRGGVVSSRQNFHRQRLRLISQIIKTINS